MIEIINETKNYKINNSAIKKIVQDILNKEKAENQDVTIKLCTDNEIKKAHKKYFNQDTVTDVISFPMNSDGYLGDILVSLDRASAVAPEFGNNFQQEFILYIIHGILHLLGYDDIDHKDKDIIKKKEQEYLGKINYKEGEVAREL